MSQYEVTAADQAGHTKKVFIESDSVKGARTKARSQGLTPISVVMADSANVAKEEQKFSSVIKNPMGSVNSQDLSNMTRQLATLVKSHVPVVESLTALVEQIEQPKLKKILISIRQQVNEGRSLADGFAQFPNVFDRVYINMVRAGESSGRLDVVLLRLADFGEARLRLRGQITGALTYPIIMVIVAFLVLGIIFVKVVPQITSIFIDMKQELPLPTKVLIAISDFAQNYFAHVLVGVLVGLWFLQGYIRTPAGRAKKDSFMLHAPILGKLTRNLAVARFARTLGTLLSSGVPMLNALQITKNVVAHTTFEETIENTGTMVSEGRSLASALKQSGEYPPIVIHMVGVGEKTGELEGMLNNVADNYEQQVETRLATLSNVLSPLMIVIMAGLVGFIVLAVLGPISEMNQFGN